MPSLDMRGPYELKPEIVDSVVAGTTPGNFAIGYCKEDGGFVCRFVGRSDSDVKTTLKKLESDVSTKFKWSPAASAKAAFDKQCRNFHDFGAWDVLENEDHPEPPKGMKWKCVFCDYFD